jgi:hypothetical protein
MTHHASSTEHVEIPNEADPEVAKALTDLHKAVDDKRKLIDVGPELMSGLVKFIKENRVQPRIIKSKSQAKRMTAKDPAGYRWRVGERYFMLVARKGA